MMEFSGEQGTTRRDLMIRALGATAVVSGIAAGIPLAPDTAHAVPARRQLAAQEDWRFCGNCHAMFFSGVNGSYYRENQRCAAGGLHNPLGFNFVLPYDVAETPTAQKHWRFCGNCHAMFFSGLDGTYYRENQRCPAGGLHNPLGYNFVLPHDVAETPTAQKDWRFCGNCHGMFFSGVNGSYYRQNQRCPAGGLHNPLGYNFVLPHRGIVPDGATPLSPEEQGIVDLVNAARKQDNCSVVLQVDPRLVGVARAHSQDLADHPGPPGLWEKGDQGKQGHYGSDGSLSADRISKAVGSTGTENSYVEWFTGTAPPPSAQRAFKWWWESKWGHQENLLNCNHKTTGVGIAQGTGIIPAGQNNAGQSATFHYYTQAFVD